jgi:hypothetical protein
VQGVIVHVGDIVGGGGRNEDGNNDGLEHSCSIYLY